MILNATYKIIFVFIQVHQGLKLMDESMIVRCRVS